MSLLNLEDNPLAAQLPREVFVKTSPAPPPPFQGGIAGAPESLNTKLTSTLHDATIVATNDMNTPHFRSRFWKDFTYGVRQLRSNPGFALAAILSLALGIGANSAIFTLGRPNPCSAPSRREPA